MRTFLAAGAAAAALIGACDAESGLDQLPPCTAAGAAEGLLVFIDVANGPLPAADYAIVIEADGVSLTIAGQGDDDAIAASGKLLHATGWMSTMDGFADIYYEEGGGPAQLAIEVRRGATVLAHADFTPTYRLDEPNGPACDPHAHNANATMIVTP